MFIDDVIRVEEDHEGRMKKGKVKEKEVLKQQNISGALQAMHEVIIKE